MKKPLISLLLIHISLIPLTSKAETNITLDFSGNIKAASCNITGGNNINIDLERIPVDLFNTPQSGSEWHDFNINLTNCSSSINQVKLTFSGAADTGDLDSLYKNQGTATNIAVQLQNGDGSIPLGNQKILTASVTNQEATIPLRTRAFSVSGNAIPGSISANITATITYL
ncbi:fimbrial protein [Providencia burhodogranariea]|uniref:Fimbrial subunit n=1 Tax=Providencia burhodogranariea DSM 19968 TaxID=1141662 RepID=K8W902_9GAMM|nr:fimbrial protein [Providencia burhodogranariea]EKT57153.1 fimbrial subunit [Providencia burhodogranariea DSM 19968]